jgi:HD-GYP domain-containing protein (c-di-GMP phosphodiesterase class II)
MILEKPGPLDEEEWAFMRQHTVIGERILGVAPSLARAAELVRASHEHFDGTGYPDGLAGEEIPLPARIIAVCDAYDAMTTGRPYRPMPMSPEGALGELRSSAGSQFDPAVVAAFEASVAEQAGSRQRSSA